MYIVWAFSSYTYVSNPEQLIYFGFKENYGFPIFNRFYNNVDIWMAPTMSEGLHLPPAEAMMTECAVVGTTAELSGIQDYIVQDETGLLSKNDIRSFRLDVEHLYNHPGCRKRLGKAGREKILEIGNRKKNMEKMIDLFMEMIS